jgi:hypothetical protein
MYFSLSLTFSRDFDVEVLDDFTGFGVFDSGEQLSEDSESVGDNTTGVTGVDTFINNLDLNINS